MHDELEIIKTFKFSSLSLKDQQDEKHISNFKLNNYYYSRDFVISKNPILSCLPGGEQIIENQIEYLKMTNPLQELYLIKFNDVLKEIKISNTNITDDSS